MTQICPVALRTAVLGGLQLSPHLAESLLRRIRAPGGSEGKESASNAGDPSSIRGLRRSRGEGNGYPLQYPCLGNPMDRGARRGTVHGVAESDTTESLNTLRGELPGTLGPALTNLTPRNLGTWGPSTVPGIRSQSGGGKGLSGQWGTPVSCGTRDEAGVRRAGG